MLLQSVLMTLFVSLLIQAVFFVFAATLRTDKVTDLSYGLTFVIIAALLLASGNPEDPPQLVLALMVMAWGVRLAGYLLFRIIHMGRDARFDGIRERFWPFFKFWLGQGVAVWLIMLPATIWFAAPGPWTWCMSIGGALWAIGLVIETVADAQKFAAKRRPGGAGRWMTTGLWKYSRHPNYFGELLCWWGVFVYVAGSFAGWSWIGLIGPLAITWILLSVTGIPTLEASANRKWGHNPEYQAHLRRTSRLLPWPPRRTNGEPSRPAPGVPGP
jgi:steroid 5-alpha reductase family enzyme